MSLIRDSIPDWVWLVALGLSSISVFFKGRSYRRTLVAAAAAPGAGKAEQDALKTQTLAGITMAVMFGGIALGFVLPRPYGFVALIIGVAAGVPFLLRARRQKS